MDNAARIPVPVGPGRHSLDYQDEGDVPAGDESSETDHCLGRHHDGPPLHSITGVLPVFFTIHR